MKQSSLPTVTVVVVARNEEAKIDQCIASVAAQNYPKFSAILVDDGSIDATVAKARLALPSIRVISSPTRSISRNRDIGWRAAGGEYVAFLDADCIAPSHWLSALVEAAQKTRAAAVGGGNMPPEGETSHYAALGLMLDSFVGSRGSIQGRIPRQGQFVTHLPGLNVMFRRDMLELVGGYDPRFARMGEDEDLSRRLVDLGLRLYVTPNATVIHRQRADLFSWTQNMRDYGRGRTWLLRRHPNAVSPIFLLPPTALLMLPIYLPIIAIYSFWIALRGGRLVLWPRLFALFAATHLAYGYGQIEGLFRRGDNVPAQGRRHRVVLLALKNAGNKGDEAISTCVSARMSQAIANGSEPIDLYLGAIGPSGFDVRPVPQGPRASELMIREMLGPTAESRAIGSLTFLSLPRLLAVVARFRAVTVAGGQWLHDLSVGNHLAICAIFGLARLFGTLTGVFCIGVGPLRSRLSRLVVRLAFSRKSMLITRDELSTRLLHECGLTQARTAADPALELETRCISAGAGHILISPCAWSSFENLYALNRGEIDKSLQHWIDLVRALIDRGQRVAILPTMNPEDGDFAKRIAAEFEHIDVIDTSNLAPEQVQGCIAQAKALVSMRLHPIIFASNTATPFVALTYAAKVTSFCVQAGYASRVVDLAEGDWVKRALDLLNEDNAGRKVAREERAQQMNSLAESYTTFSEWLLSCSKSAIAPCNR